MVSGSKMISPVAACQLRAWRVATRCCRRHHHWVASLLCCRAPMEAVSDWWGLLQDRQICGGHIYLRLCSILSILIYIYIYMYVLYMHRNVIHMYIYIYWYYYNIPIYSQIDKIGITKDFWRECSYEKGKKKRLKPSHFRVMSIAIGIYI